MSHLYAADGKVVLFLETEYLGAKLQCPGFLLDHVSVETTERYLGCKQRLPQAVNDKIGSSSELDTVPPAATPAQWKRSPLSVRWKDAVNTKASGRPILEAGLIR